MTAQDEIDMITRWRGGDRAAGNALMRAHERLVKTIAREYRRWGVPLDDLTQEGNIGLLKAAERFDPTKGARLATYAAFWIRAQIREHVAQYYRIVRLGSSKGERRLMRLHRQSIDCDPDVLAVQAGLTREQVEAALPSLMCGDLSLNHETSDGDTPQDRLVSAGPSPEDAVGEHQEQRRVSSAVADAIAELPEREQMIANARWLVEEPETLDQLGEDMGISKERVRQIEDRAKERVRVRLSFDATIRAAAPYVARATSHDGKQASFMWAIIG